MSTWLSSYDPGEAQTTFTKRILQALSLMRFLSAQEEIPAACGSILGD
jgi:hypothetical protein